MQCNQPFDYTKHQPLYGNGFMNGPFCSSYSTPLHSNQSMYPEVVGEGEVTSVTLPDGSMQFFFMPTLKWWSSNGSQCHSFPTIADPMFGNTNYNIPPFNNTAGTWLIRRISNQLPQNVFSPSTQRNELSGNINNMVCNMSTHDFGYQLKFHNDNWTSTTDLVYFFPCLRHRDFVFTPPCKDEIVQINAVPVAYNHEVVCSKACVCCIDPKPMSLDSIVDSKLTSKRNKATTDDFCCDGLIKKHKRSKDRKNRRYKTKNTICWCDSTANVDYTVDKSVTTCADKGSSCTPTPADGRETQTYGPEESKRVCNKPIIKFPLKPKLRFCMSYSSCSTTDESTCVDSIKKINNRHRHVKYKLNKPRKRVCGCDSATSSVSENETMATTDGCQTPFCIISKSCSKNVAQDSPSEQNTLLTQWFNSDDEFPQCKHTWFEFSNKAAMEGKSSDNFLSNSSACDSNSNTSCRN